MAIRKRNDFILSILSFAIGLFLFASESTVSGVMLFVGLPFLAEPRTFIQGIGILLMVFSIPLFLKSISLKGERDSGKFRLKKETIITLIALLLFVPAYELIGFPIASFLLTFCLSVVYGLCEESQREEHERPSKKKFYLIRFVYSLVVVTVLVLVFTQILHVKFF